jgi:hypothetical protein
MDRHCQLAPITLKALRDDAFDHKANWATEVRNVSSVGSQNNAFIFNATI